MEKLGNNYWIKRITHVFLPTYNLQFPAYKNMENQEKSSTS